MPSVVDFLAFRQIGFCKSKKYLDGKKAVLDLLEYEAAKPSNNEPCEFSGEPRATFLVDFSPNMLRAASTHGDHSVRITDVETGKCTHVLTGHPRTPWCLAFNPTSNDILASGCLGGEVRIWDLLGGGSEVLHNPSLGAVITSLAFHPSGQVLVFATINCIYFWDWNKPTPFAVTKTNHEYERIRWLRFDPLGKYLYTGIANNTTLHGERARNVVNIRAPSSESRGGRHTRSLLLRNRLRYNQLMQRFRSLQQSQNQRVEYPESVRPRSPVHEESLNLARQYASHITERGLMRSGIIRDGYLHQGRDSISNRTSQPTADARTEGERSRGWGRYQPSFFTNSDATSTSNSNANDNSSARTGVLRIGIRPNARSLRSQGRSRYSARRTVPYAVRAQPRSVRSERMRSSFEPSVTLSRLSSSTSSSSDDLEPNHVADELEPDEFEILPVDRIESETTSADGNESSREFDGMSASEMAQRLEQQLRQLRRELFNLTQRNMDINSAIMTLPNHGSSQSSPRPGTTSLEGSNSHRSAFRSAGSALSRSMFSRSGNNSNTSAMSASSSLYSSSSILTSALSTSSAFSSTSSSSHSSMILSRSIPSSVPFISYAPNSGMTRSSITSTISSSSANAAPGASNEHSAVDLFSSRERLRLRAVPTTVTDSTSQTFGAMNLPEQLDRSTDMTGLDSEQNPRNGTVSENSVVENSTVDIADVDTTIQSSREESNTSVDSSSDSGSGLAFSNGNTSTLLQQPSFFQFCTSPSGAAQTQVTTTSSPCTSSTCSVPSLGILRSALTASSSSSLIPPFPPSSLPSTTHQNSTNSALSSNTSASSNTGSTLNPSYSSQPSALNDRRVFRSIASLRRNLSNIMSEERLESQMVMYNGELIPLNSVLPQSSDNSSNESRRENGGSDLPVVESAASSSVVNESASVPVTSSEHGSASVSVTSSEHGNTTSTLRTSIASLQRRVSDVLQNIRTSQAQSGGSSGHEQVEDRFMSQTSQILSQTTAYWTEFLGRSVMELNQRISELERRLETNQYLLSSNPFHHQRPGRPQDALMSSLFRNRAGARNPTERPTDGDEDRSETSRDDTPPPPPPPPPSTAGDHAANPRQNARGQRNQLLLDFLVWRGLRDSQSQRSLSFGQSGPSELLSSSVTSSSSQPSIQAPILSSTLSAASTSSSLSSLLSSVPQSVTIHPSRDADSDEGNDDDEEDEMMQDREEQGNRRGRRRQLGSGNEGGGDSRWLGLQNIHLHPDYSSSILDDTINRPNETMQHIMNRTIAGVLDREEQAVASNIIPQTHRIQRWNVSDVVVPCISRVTANIVVEQCKLHNDASCDISKDGTTLATFVPSHRGFPDDNILGVFSLRKETFAQCLYTKSFGPNAISVSISPANHYVMVGLAARRYFLFSLSNKMVGQVYKLVKEKAGEKSMEHITDLFHPRARGVQLHISVNFGRWLPGIGEGIVYGTNRGDLHFCRPGPRQVPELDSLSSLHSSLNLRRNVSIRSSIATQTTTVSIRRTASTQTQGDEEEDLASTQTQGDEEEDLARPSRSY